jgi:serine/threonine protein kinase
MSSSLNVDDDILNQYYMNIELLNVCSQKKTSIFIANLNENDQEKVLIKRISAFSLENLKKLLIEVDFMDLFHDQPYFAQMNRHFVDYKTCILYIEMKYYQYGDLGQFIKAKNELLTTTTSKKSKLSFSMSEENIWNFIFQMTSALKILYECKTTHHDIKPCNIYIEAMNDDADVDNKKQPIQFRLGDFGTCFRWEGADKTATDGVGTEQYVSPEQFSLSKYYKPTYKIDICSLGYCIVAMCAMKEQTFGSLTERQILDLIPFGLYSDTLLQFIRNMIQPNPQDRISTPELFAIAQVHQERIIRQRESAINQPIKTPTHKKCMIM